MWGAARRRPATYAYASAPAGDADPPDARIGFTKIPKDFSFLFFSFYDIIVV